MSKPARHASDPGAAPDPPEPSLATASGRPRLLASYRALPTLGAWFERVRTFCADPPAAQERAAEWILDNDYQIKRALRRLQEGLPRDFYDKLPAIAGPGGPGAPRIFVIAQTAFDVLEPQITLPGLIDVVGRYQRSVELTNAELWAMPALLRLVCLERFMDAVGDMDPALTPPVEMSAETRAAKADHPVDAISRAIPNLARIDSIRWADFLDAVSVIEAELTRDPAGVYSAMTVETRNRYRRVVEEMAERSDRSEAQIARRTVAMSEAADTGSPENHVGHWLIGDGVAQLEADLDCRVPAMLALRRWAVRRSGRLYAAGLVTLALTALSVAMLYLWMAEATPLQFALGIALSILPATIPSVWFGHWLITRLSTPGVLPEMDFAEEIPSDCATAIVIPVIVATAEEVDTVAEKIEILHVANPDPAFRFVLLSDLADAPSETLREDAAIETRLQERIAALNQRNASQTGPPFVLMHRRRRHNPAEGCWMAPERKRGKLEDFNRFVLGEDRAAFDLVAGPAETLAGLRYAITLDADTQLPPGAAARLVGIIAHPLNRAVIDPATGRVTSGHAILQPRIEILPKLGKGTHFSHLYGGDTAIDIYSRAVSDVYQDLFGTGIFVGKGIYDIAALQRSMAGRIPDNHILSHDLFEGLHGRAALVSNVVLYEDLPVTYPEFALRQHRWMRGDWQLLPWLGRRVPTATGKARSSLSALDRWKMLDNLRRSLMSPALLLFFLAGWLVLPGSALVWTVLALAAPGSYLIGELFAVATGGVRKGIVGNLIHQIRVTGGRWFFLVAFLVSDTLIALDAIARTLWRVGVSGRNRLEWTSAAHAAVRFSESSPRRASWQLMWPSTALAPVLAGHLVIFDPAGFWTAVPVLLLWLVAPEISAWSARPRFFRSETLQPGQRAFLTRIARRTWHFFETFVGPEDNWLPPDNYQFGEVDQVAHRTSPTNIGMFLTAALAARDHGFITTSDFLARSQHTVETLTRMTSYRGHILNWYDTRTLEPLEPHYVSTVDSGNLAVALVTLKQGCLDHIDRPAIRRADFEGLGVTLDLLSEALRDGKVVESDGLRRAEMDVREALDEAIASPLAWTTALAELAGPLWQALETRVRDAVEAAPDLSEDDVTDINTWLERFHHGVLAIQRDTESFMPWLAVLSDAPDGIDFTDLTGAIDAHGDERLPVSGMARAVSAWVAALGDAHSEWVARLQSALTEGTERNTARDRSLRELAELADEIAFGMDFRFLYDRSVRLFSIGYNQSLGRMDGSHYDLLATEARLASYFAIAKHDVPIEHWFSFTRPITRLQGKPSILSWNGSMFEYLMPPLFLASYRDSLLGESELTAIDFQCDYARARGVPWGISESAFGTTDTEGVFQYRAFGVPGLGIRRGLTEDLVIAPYGSALALCGWPDAAAENLQDLARLGAQTRYGFIEALDFTPDRTPAGQDFVPVTTFMAHHQGMLQVAIANALFNDIMVTRLRREKSILAMDLLLQERVPWDVPLELGRADEAWERPTDERPLPDLVPWVPSPDFVVPQLHMLGNGNLSSLVTETGGGGLTLKDTALTRWRPDPTRTAHGLWVYLQDEARGTLWSLGSSPTGRADGETRCVFHQHMVELLRRHHGIVARMDVTVAAYDNAEVRRITLINEGDSTRTIDLTSLGEVVLAPPRDDERHPAFSKLFVHSRFLPEERALLFTRRPRSPETRPPVLLHKLIADDPDITLRTWDTDRHRVVGRNCIDAAPAGLQDGMSETGGWTLDPVMALQVRVRLRPMEAKELVFLTVAGSSPSDARAVSRRFSMATMDQVFRDALLETGRRVQKLGLAAEHLPDLQVLASLLQHPHPRFRGPPIDDPAGWNGQSDLWRFGISGDDPILVLKVSDPETSALLDTLVRGHRLWRQAGLRVDLAILRDRMTSYEEPLRERVLSILSDTNAKGLLGMRAGIHLLSADQMPAALLHGIEAAAHVVLHDENRPLREMLDRVLGREDRPPPFVPGPSPRYTPVSAVSRPTGLLFDNGYGGFDPQTGDYVVHLGPGQSTPAPWCNVLANEDFGCLVSEAGFGATWALNSGEHRLTPWSNDPVTDAPGEALYLRDEADGAVWSPTPRPMGQEAPCTIRHGFGFTRWQKNSHGLEQDVLTFVPVDASVKLVRLRLTNRSGLARRISATYYVEWLLGALGSVSRPHVVSDYDPALKAIVARNFWSAEFAARAAFLTASHDPHSVTGDRDEFLGREGSVHDPEGLRRWDLGGHFPGSGDSCAAYQVHIDLPPDERAEVVFALGETADRAALDTQIARWRDPGETGAALAALAETWSGRLGAVQVKTPDPAFDLMINGWLPYQNRSCRIMARGAFYQAGGAYGMRDQLQDVLGLLMSDPDRARAHILRAAAAQFEEGDALHWWHPPLGRGVRTRCSDDYLWLAYVTARYIRATGDTAILDVDIPFLTAPELQPGEHDRYALFETGETGTLYDHCARAMDHMMTTGAHGLPLMGGGDWNDGMDRIGADGRGESVWLAWFQIATVDLFAGLAANVGHPEDAARWRAHAEALTAAVRAHAWDGAWYLRAFDDGGLPWGSKDNEECRIDLIAQAWSVIATGSADGRARAAMEAALEQLVDPDERLIRLLTPPFDKTPRNPGYIQAYPPGVRENGGQYTHAAAWLGIAYARMGEGDLAHQVFDIISPVRRTDSKAGADHYRREPYVLAGDVSGVGTQTGQGGWSWYTGAAGWTWQLGVNGILGIERTAAGVRITPTLPKAWRHASVCLDGVDGRLEIEIRATKEKAGITVDGCRTETDVVRFPGAGQTRKVVVACAAAAAPVLSKARAPTA